MDSAAPRPAIDACAASHAGLDAMLEGLTDAHALAPSLLPGWTVGHVLTHIARNADGLGRIVEGAGRGEATEMYPGWPRGREADIAAGSRRSADELVADVRAANARLEAVFEAAPAAAWAGTGATIGGPPPHRRCAPSSPPRGRGPSCRPRLGYRFEDLAGRLRALRAGGCHRGLGEPQADGLRRSPCSGARPGAAPSDWLGCSDGSRSTGPLRSRPELMPCPRRRRVALVALAVVGGVSATLGLGASRALAHAGLESSTPAASSVLESSPPQIVLDFDEDVDVPLTSIQLYDQGGATIEVGEPGAGADGSIVASSVPPLEDGTYAVVWLITSADGHVISGAFSFQIGTASTVDAGDLLDSVQDGARAAPAVGRALGFSRFLSFAGASLLVGGVFMVLMLGTAVPIALGRGGRLVLVAGWVLLVVGAALNFGLLGANAQAGSLGDVFDTSIWGRVARTRTGGVLVVRLAVAALWGVVLAFTSRRASAWWRTSVSTLATATVFTFSAAGHPSVERFPAIWVTVDAIHLGFVLLWMGSLAMMAVGGRAWLRDEARGPAVQRFSLMATVGVPLIVLTGIAQGWRIGGGLSSLVETSWGRLLLAKSAIAVLVITIGGASRWLLQNDGPSSLRRTVTTEAVLGIAVLGLAAGLVGSPPTAGPQSALYNETLAEAGVLVDIAITPGHVGANEVHMVVTPPGGNLTTAAGVTARMTLPARDLPYIPVTIAADSPNHYTGNVTLPFAGAWTLEVVVTPAPGQSVLMTSVVDIP